MTINLLLVKFIADVFQVTFLDDYYFIFTLLTYLTQNQNG
jgi:hypothetical protein